jgi:putative aminopeptidase FrvX
MNWDLLKKLSETPSVPGREDALRAVVMDTLRPLVDELSVDIMGNVMARRAGQGGRRVMLAAHMDEIGFMVRHIDDKGFLRLQALGGFDARMLFAQRVVVHTRTGETLRGVLTYSTKPTHLLNPEELKESPKVENVMVDVGLAVDEVRKRVAVGDMVTMDRTCEACGDHLIGKAMDNRIGLFVMLETLRALGPHEVELVAVATVQEEIGLRGAGTAAFSVEPAVGIALDTTLANDLPGLPEAEAITRLGQGVAIKIMDASLICHPGLVEHFRSIAERTGIPHQMEILPRGGTDGGALQRTRGGTASITISIPTRYIHTVNEMVSKKDVEAAVRLLVAYMTEAHTRSYLPT